jgi:hypothetical protein
MNPAAAPTLRTGTVGSQDESPGRAIHKIKGKVKGAGLKAAATESKPWGTIIFRQGVNPAGHTGGVAPRGGSGWASR